ncbi:hypothetical protein MBLNU457_7271t1 [Dothideomycetes sp. NU457]
MSNGHLNPNQKAVQHRTLLNTVVEERASQTPHKTYAYVPKTEDIEDGFREMSYHELHNAVMKMAHWLDTKLGKLPQTRESRECIAYIGPNDLRYSFLLLAADRTNRKLLIPLMYNSTEAQIRLIEACECSTVIAPASHVQWWDAVRAAKPEIKYLEMTPLEHFYGTEDIAAYPYTKRFDNVYNEICYVIQTSGTTGFPKPLPQSHATIAFTSIAKWRNDNLPPDQRYATYSGWTTSLNVMPYSWIAGIVATVYFPIILDQQVTVLPSSTPQPVPTSLIRRACELVPSISAMLFTPMMLKQMVLEPESLKLLYSLGDIFFAGAPLDEDIGDMIAKHTRVTSIIGSTDIGCGYPVLKNANNADWMWQRLEVDVPGSSWRLVHFTDDMYELVVDRDPDTPLPWTYVHPEMQTYHTADLFREHPTKKGYWKMCGRADDFVKLASMTKFNAISIESAVNRHSEVERCVVGGDARRSTFVILQPSNQDYSSKEEALEKMWPGVETANQSIFSEARLKKVFAIVADKDRPIEITPKGTAQRRKALQDYEVEIQALYKDEGPQN